MAGEDRKSPTEEIINQCIETLEDERKSKQAEVKALKRACELKECVEDYKICCLVKSREVWDTYNNLDLCYTISSYKKVTLLNEDVKRYCDKEKELEQKLKEAVKCIKETKTKLNDVVNEACKIERCIKEEKRCKKGLYEQLKGPKNEWKTLLEDIESCSTDCFNRACMTFDIGVDVVGIQTFVDIESLKTLGEDLQEYLEEYRSDVDANIQKAEIEWKKARAELVVVKEELVAGKFAKCDADNCKDGLKETIEFLCDPHGCEQIDDPGIDEICAKVKDNFGKDIGEDCDDEEDDKKPSPKRKKPEGQEEWEVD